MSGWVVALVIDLLWGEPPAFLHPVVGIGRAVAFLEARAPAGGRMQLAYGAILTGAVTALATLAGALAGRLRPAPLRFVLGPSLLKTTFALRALLDGANVVERRLRGGDLDAARSDLRALVSRPTAELDEDHIASATVESLAENLSDSYIAPLFFYRVGGLPAALAYRAVNTADAMIGYHGRYEFLGKAAAWTDDVLNWVPARLAALALVAAAPLVGLDARAAWRVARRDHRDTESPNAGWPMAAAAGACGVWLEKPGQYRLGSAGRTPSCDDVARASRLVLTAALLATAVALFLKGPSDA